MKYPEALLLPLLMLADYFLTVLGAIQSEKGYSLHFRMEQYELNPQWQKAIARKRWFNPRHLALTAANSALIIFLVEWGGLPDPLNPVLLGALLTVFALLVGRHINNLLAFRRLQRRPNDVSGTVTMTHAFVLSSSLYQTLLVFIPVALLAFISGDPYALGAAIGVGLLGLIHLGWMRKAARSKSA